MVEKEKEKADWKSMYDIHKSLQTIRVQISKSIACVVFLTFTVSGIFLLFPHFHAF